MGFYLRIPHRYKTDLIFEMLEGRLGKGSVYLGKTDAGLAVGAPPRRRSLAWSFDKTIRLPLCTSVASTHAEDFREGRLQILFYSNEHRPIHVHVRYGSGEAVFDVEHRVELRESQGLKVRELTKAEELATEHLGLIIRRRHEHFNR